MCGISREAVDEAEGPTYPSPLGPSFVLDVRHSTAGSTAKGSTIGWLPDLRSLTSWLVSCRCNDKKISMERRSR